ncbi:MAG: DUF5597 domain-containing protein [Flammeovirgaceae bacterium]|nr:DUF5597 domain-containing protein [Flammeovirgaceae bacterium]
MKKKGNVTQLIVEGKPFIVLGGELGNSTFTSVEYMKPVWPNLKAMNLNTVLAPVFWELIEPTEGEFDFELLDELIGEARKNDFKLILLWFGSWKNSMSSHAPGWVKKNQKKFPRIKDEKGKSHEILTPFSDNNLQADVRAFKALMKHLKEFDIKEQTVIMVQPENEIGMLPSARDYHPLANKKFGDSVPSELIKYLKENKKKLVPEFYAVWEKNGFKTDGTWEEIFGKGAPTDEIFMAWFYSKFTNELIEVGKEVYPLPMFVNAALNAPGREPGEYPSAGPLPHIMDIWKAGGKSIDFLSPDFYNPDFEHWNDLYTRQANPLFIPEHRFDNTVAAKAAFAIGHYEGIGFSPFSIESKEKPEEEDLGKMYGLIEQMMPLISDHQGQGKIEGVLLDKEKQETTFALGNYTFKVRHSHVLGWEAAAKNKVWEPAGALFIQTGESEFYVAGSGITVTFSNKNKPVLITGILKYEEGRFNNNEWEIIRHLNGDQTHQGRHLRIFRGEYTIQRIELYDYK